MFANGVRDRIRHVEVGENISLRKDVAKRFHHLFSTTHVDQPKVDDGYLHATTFMQLPSCNCLHATAFTRLSPSIFTGFYGAAPRADLRYRLLFIAARSVPASILEC